MKYEILTLMDGDWEIEALATQDRGAVVREMARRSREIPGNEEQFLCLILDDTEIVRYENRGGKWVLE